jgi:hypothetical protein
MRKVLQKIYWVCSTQFGLDPRRMLRSLRGIPRYLLDLVRFRAQYDGRLGLQPCLYDWYEEGGTSNNEYFWQDLHVAQKIFLANPQRHVDVGSRLDGFVAHVAAFRQIEVFDIRPVSTVIPGVIFRQADLMNPQGLQTVSCDSVSCLHALEHFGLGRYGDPIDADGHATGLRHLAQLLVPAGTLYLAVPVGRARVAFNANRVFDPADLLRLAAADGLTLVSLVWLEPGQLPAVSAHLEADLHYLSGRDYALGIFTFSKQ